MVRRVLTAIAIVLALSGCDTGHALDSLDAKTTTTAPAKYDITSQNRQLSQSWEQQTDGAKDAVCYDAGQTSWNAEAAKYQQRLGEPALFDQWVVMGYLYSACRSR